MTREEIEKRLRDANGMAPIFPPDFVKMSELMFDLQGQPTREAGRSLEYSLILGAVLAERERCARIAEMAGKGSTSIEHEKTIESFSMSVAAAIRKDSK